MKRTIVASRCAKNVKVPSKVRNSEISAANSPSSIFLSTPRTRDIFKGDHFFEYLNSKCQHSQNQALSNTFWSSRHLSVLASGNKPLNFVEHEDRDILKPCSVTIPGIETDRGNFSIKQDKTFKNWISRRYDKQEPILKSFYGILIGYTNCPKPAEPIRITFRQFDHPCCVYSVFCI